jgi:hypothetical protein
MTGATIKNSHSTWNEAERLAALKDFDVLDTEPEAAIDNLAKVAANVDRKHDCYSALLLISRS